MLNLRRKSMSKYPNYCEGDNRYPTEQQERTMNMIVHYIPDTLEEREDCDTKDKASEFIGKYIDELNELRGRKYRRV